RTVLSGSTVAGYWKLQMRARSVPRRTGRHAGVASTGGMAKRRLCSGRKARRTTLACSTVVAPAKRSSDTKRSWSVPHSRSTPQPLDAALGRGRERKDHFDLQRLQGAADLGGVLHAAQLLFERPVLVVAFQAPMAIHVGAQRQPLLLRNRLEHPQIPARTFLLD